MKMKVIGEYVLIIIMFNLFSTGELLITESVSLALIHAVISHYQPACIFLLFSETGTQLNMHDLMKLMEIRKSLEIPFTIMDIHSFRKINRDSAKEDRPLYVILTSNNITRQSLIGMPTSIGVVNPKWLLFLEETESIDDFMNDIFIQFNNEFLIAQPKKSFFSEEYTLTEVYYVSQNSPLIKKQYGIWNTKKHSSWPKLELYERRNSLEGTVIRAAVIHNLPITSVRRNGAEIQLTGGYFGSVWKVIENQLNFRTKYFTPHQQTSRFLENGTFYGMLNMVVWNKVDVAIDSFQMTSATHPLVDFSVPLMFTRIRVFIQDSGDTVIKWDDFTHSFRPELWVTIIFSILFIGIYFAILYHCGYYSGNNESERNFIYTLPHSIFSTFGAFCSQGQPVIPRSISCRIVFLTTYLTAYVIITAYSGSIISYLTVKYPKLPFNDLQGLLQDASYKLGILANSAINNMMKDTDNPTLHNAHNKLIKPYIDSMPQTVQEGLERVCGSEKFAFMIEYDIASALMSKIKCRPVVLPDTSVISSTSMVFKKNGPYREVINYLLYKLRAGGILRRHLLEWSSYASNPETQIMEVGLSDIVPIFSLLALATLFSFFLLLFEIYNFRKENYKDKDEQLKSKILDAILESNEKLRKTQK